jgi:hypothetical protein
MWGNKKIALIGAGSIVALAVVYLVLHGVPGFGSDALEPEPVTGAPSASPGGGGENGTGDSGNASGGPGDNSGSPDSSGSPGSGGSKGRPLPYQTVLRIARQPKAKDLPKLKEAAATPDWRTREAAIVGIGRLGKEGSDPEFLVQSLQNDPSAEVRAAAAAGLGRLRCWDGGHALIRALSDRDEIVRARAGAALQKIMGVDVRFRANDPPAQRAAAIQKIRTWWPKFYQGHLQSRGR